MNSPDPQTTIRKPFSMIGRSLYENKEVTMTCEPHENGIVFEYDGLQIPATFAYINEEEDRYTTSLKRGNTVISVTEHLLSAFYGMNIDNVLIHLDYPEPPFCASSIDFVKLIKEAGIETLDVPRKYVEIDHWETIRFGDRHIDFYPSKFTVYESHVDYKNILGEQSYVYKDTIDRYEEEISECRTYLFYALDHDDLWEKARNQFQLFPEDPKNAPYITFDSHQYLSAPNFVNEIARHKILDMIGDLALLGRRVKGYIAASKTGHALNRKAVQMLAKKYL